MIEGAQKDFGAYIKNDIFEIPTFPSVILYNVVWVQSSKCDFVFTISIDFGTFNNHCWWDG